MQEQMTLQQAVKYTKFKGKYDDRQDYLAALVQHFEAALTDNDFDKLTDDAAQWYSNAIAAMKANLEIPDFEDDDDSETEEASEEENDEGAEVDDDPEEAVAGADAGDLEPDSKPARKSAKPKRGDSDDKPAKAGKAAKGKVQAAPKSAKRQPDYSTLTGEKDRFGITIGTKTHEAVKMYEKGCTAKQLDEELGGRHYNILGKLEKEGHHVEKSEGGVWKIIHKDDYGKKAKGK